jgi:hypothetical protein
LPLGEVVGHWVGVAVGEADAAAGEAVGEVEGEGVGAMAGEGVAGRGVEEGRGVGESVACASAGEGVALPVGAPGEGVAARGKEAEAVPPHHPRPLLLAVVQGDAEGDEVDVGLGVGEVEAVGMGGDCVPMPPPAEGVGGGVREAATPVEVPHMPLNFTLGLAETVGVLRRDLEIVLGWERGAVADGQAVPDSEAVAQGVGVPPPAEVGEAAPAQEGDGEVVVERELLAHNEGAPSVPLLVELREGACAEGVMRAAVGLREGDVELVEHLLPASVPVSVSVGLALLLGLRDTLRLACMLLEELWEGDGRGVALSETAAEVEAHSVPEALGEGEEEGVRDALGRAVVEGVGVRERVDPGVALEVGVSEVAAPCSPQEGLGKGGVGVGLALGQGDPDAPTVDEGEVMREGVPLPVGDASLGVGEAVGEALCVPLAEALGTRDGVAVGDAVRVPPPTPSRPTSEAVAEGLLLALWGREGDVDTVADAVRLPSSLEGEAVGLGLGVPPPPPLPQGGEGEGVALICALRLPPPPCTLAEEAVGEGDCVNVPVGVGMAGVGEGDRDAAPPGVALGGSEGTGEGERESV